MTTSRDPRRNAPGFLREFWRSLVRGLGDTIGRLIALFTLGTAAGAVVTLFTGVGLQYAFVGGVVLVLVAILFWILLNGL
ncbi:MAG: hypothetical protein AAGF44_03145 [Pseudomonadota bacterium]